MQNIELHSNTDYSYVLDSFIGAICDLNHLNNYYATIEVPVFKAVECVLSNNFKASIASGYSPEGIFFTVSGELPSFIPLMPDVIPDKDIAVETSFLVSLLADNFYISADRLSMKIIFAVRGIDSVEAASRIAVLDQMSIHTPTLLHV